MHNSTLHAPPCARSNGAVFFWGSRWGPFRECGWSNLQLVDGLWAERLYLRAGRYINTAGAVWASDSKGRIAKDWSAEVLVGLRSRTFARILVCICQLGPHRHHCDNDDSRDVFQNLAVSTI